MQVISICYDKIPHWKVSQALKKTLFSFRRPSGRKEYNDGVVSLHGFLLFSAAQSDGFTWASKDRMSREFAANPRTTERRLRKLTESGFIKAGLRWIGGRLRRGYYILAQQDILEALQRAGIAYRLLDIDESAKKPTNPAAPTADSAPAPAPPSSQEVRQVVRQFVDDGIYKDRTPEPTFFPPYPPAGGASRVEEELRGERRAQQADPQGSAPQAAPVSEPQPPKQAPACAGFTEQPPSLPESSPQSIAVAARQVQSSACATQEAIARPQPESPAWQAALALICQRVPAGEVDLWLKPIHALETKDGLQLDCEDEHYKAWIVDKFHKEIVRALKETGFDGTIFYSVGLYKKAIEKTIEQQRKARIDESFNNKMNELSQLDWKVQFREFVRAYPQKGLPAGLGRVEKLFGRLHRRGGLPTIDVLFRVLNTLKRSHQWTKDGGKYVIGIEKFLRNAPWNDFELWSGSFV